MRLKSQLIIWVIVLSLLTLLYANAFESYLYSFYFICMLFPVTIGVSYFFNYLLVPRYLLPKRYWKFGLYTTYMLIIALYLELMVVYLSFSYLAHFDIMQMHPSILQLSGLTVTLFGIALGHGFVLILGKMKSVQTEKEVLEQDKQKEEKGYLNVRSDRQMKRILFDDILYIESLSDYISIHSNSQQPVMSKLKISHVHSELPNSFLRIHRSYIVNTAKVDSFKSDALILDSKRLPISRSYKTKVKEWLSKQS